MNKIYSITLKQVYTVEMEVVATDEADARRQAEEADHIPWNKVEPDRIILVEEKVEKKAPDWVKRVPNKVSDAIVVVGDQAAKIPYSTLESEIIARTRTAKLTDSQRDKLREDVIVYLSNGDNTSSPVRMAAPTELYANDKMFQDFANEKIKSMAAYGAANNKIVDTICRYEAPQGWVAYKNRRNRPPTTLPTEQAPSRTEGGFSSSVKRVEDDTD